MSEPIRLLPPRIPPVDMVSGAWNREWYLFFMQIYERVGGANAPSNTDLAIDLFEDAGSSELQAQLNSLCHAALQQPLFPSLPLPGDDQTPPTVLPLPYDDQTPPSVCCPLPDDPHAELAAMRDQVAELTKTVDGALAGMNQMSAYVAELLKEIDALKQAIAS